MFRPSPPESKRSPQPLQERSPGQPIPSCSSTIQRRTEGASYTKRTHCTPAAFLPVVGRQERRASQFSHVHIRCHEHVATALGSLQQRRKAKSQRAPPWLRVARPVPEDQLLLAAIHTDGTILRAVRQIYTSACVGYTSRKALLCPFPRGR